MTEFMLMILIQTVIVGMSLYFWIKSIVQCVTATTWGTRILNFSFALFFFAAVILVGFYWWDTIETNNTFFAKPMPKLIELKVK